MTRTHHFRTFLSEFNAHVATALRAAGLSVVPCGLNGDWNCQAWHLGPSSQPNRVDGDFYLLDMEDGDLCSIVTRSYVDGDNDEITEVVEPCPVAEAIRVFLNLTRP
jgi:hypothetical protein